MVERDKFRFTGWDEERYEDVVKVSMKDYVNSMNEIQKIRRADRNEKLSKIKMKEYRMFARKLSWLTWKLDPT